MAGNKSLHSAKMAKQDEFYTQLSDIEKELGHYKRHFENKTVFCNCDDPEYSNFYKYFVLNFTELKLKRLITTHFDPTEQTYKIDIINPCSLENPEHIILKENGDFRSDECIEFLKQADIICTNPPFSLFRDFVSILLKYNKKFIIIGSQNAINYNDIFSSFVKNEIWLGHKSGDMAFKVPSSYEERTTRFWVDESGQKWRSLGNICWYTNLDHEKRHENLILYKKYNPEDYPTYENFNAINIDKVTDIPCDYDGIMGVPITFLDKYNPEQFEILNIDSKHCGNIIGEKFIEDYKKHGGTGHITANMDSLCFYKKSIPIVPYARILIRRK